MYMEKVKKNNLRYTIHQTLSFRYPPKREMDSYV